MTEHMPADFHTVVGTTITGWSRGKEPPQDSFDDDPPLTLYLNDGRELTFTPMSGQSCGLLFVALRPGGRT